MKFIQDNIQRFLSHLLYKSSSNPTFKITHKILHINKYSSGIIYKLLLVKSVKLPRSLTATGLVLLFHIHIKKKKEKENVETAEVGLVEG